MCGSVYISVYLFVQAVAFEMGTSHFMNAIYIFTISIKELHQGQVSKSNAKNRILHKIFCDIKFSFEGVKVKVKFIKYQGHIQDKLQNLLSVFPGFLPAFYPVDCVHLTETNQIL